MKFSDVQTKIILDIVTERKRQDELYGKQVWNDGEFLQVLIEEVGEIAQAMQAGKSWSKLSDRDNKYDELIQAAAVCVKYAEQIREEYK